MSRKNPHKELDLIMLGRMKGCLESMRYNIEDITPSQREVINRLYEDLLAISDAVLHGWTYEKAQCERRNEETRFERKLDEYSKKSINK